LNQADSGDVQDRQADLHGRSRNAEVARGSIERLLFCCELNTAMTEHNKAQPRIYGELNSSHGIVHAGDNDSIAGGVRVVNIADRFASPLLQTRGQPLDSRAT
jgi:hypothetical protein